MKTRNFCALPLYSLIFSVMAGTVYVLPGEPEMINGCYRSFFLPKWNTAPKESLISLVQRR
jgi:hypothetical protein